MAAGLAALVVHRGMSGAGSGSTMGDDESGWDSNSADDMVMDEDSDGCQPPLAEEVPADGVRTSPPRVTSTEEPGGDGAKKRLVLIGTSSSVPMSPTPGPSSVSSMT